MTEGSGPNLQELFQTAQRVQSELTRVQGELAKKTVEGSAGGGMVKVVANGRQQILSINIEREVFDANDVAMLQDLIVAAANQALQKAAELAQSELGKVTGQMNLKLPGLL
jgi:nucleoid-associated protein EbfC